MMRAAVEGLTDERGERKTRLIAVTILTSTSEETLHREAAHRAAPRRSLHSLRGEREGGGPRRRRLLPAGEPVIHERCGEGFLTVTPAVRFAGGEKGDQVRVTTPAKARELGSDYIVMGRPITGAADPVETWKRARAEFLGGNA